MMMRFSHARLSSTVLPFLEKYIKKRHTAAHTTAAMVAIPMTSLYTFCMAVLAISKIFPPAASLANTVMVANVKAVVKPKARNEKRGINAAMHRFPFVLQAMNFFLSRYLHLLSLICHNALHITAQKKQPDPLRLLCCLTYGSLQPE